MAGQPLGDSLALGLPLGRALAPELLGDPAVEPVDTIIEDAFLDTSRSIYSPRRGVGFDPARTELGEALTTS